MKIGLFTAIAIVVLAITLGGAIVWGVGNLVIYAFNLPYEFTYLQGCAVSLALSVIRGGIRTKG